MCPVQYGVSFEGALSMKNRSADEKLAFWICAACTPNTETSNKIVDLLHLNLSLKKGNKIYAKLVEELDEKVMLFRQIGKQRINQPMQQKPKVTKIKPALAKTSKSDDKPAIIDKTLNKIETPTETTIISSNEEKEHLGNSNKKNSVIVGEAESGSNSDDSLRAASRGACLHLGR